MRRISIAVFAACLGVFAPAGAEAEEGAELTHQSWSFAGMFGTYDRAAAQRGLQVYTEVCAACHSLSLLSYRHLSGIGLDEDAIEAIAAAVTVTDGPNDEGDMFDRPGRPADRFVAPFANDKAARAANNGAFPPDLSLIVKARPGGADYVYALLTGYEEPPAGFELQDGMNYNAYFTGHQIAMPAPLSDDAVTYADGTPATVAQMAHDLTTFFAWSAEPEAEARKRMGVKVVLFLIVLTFLFYAVKRKVWRGLH